MKATRRTAREWAIQMLVAKDLNPATDVSLTIEQFWNSLVVDDEGEPCVVTNRGLREFAESRVRGVIEKLDEIDGILEPLLQNWDLYRLGTVERAVLRMGVWEMKFSDVPKPVVINEAVDLANWFSSPRSRSLVNGVLDKLAKQHPATPTYEG